MQEDTLLQVNVPYIVTTPADNGDLEVGFHIIFTDNKALYCMERDGYLHDMGEIRDTLRGVEVTPDLAGIHHVRLTHLAAIKALTAFPEPSEEEMQNWYTRFDAAEAALDVSPEDIILDMSVGTDNPQ